MVTKGVANANNVKKTLFDSIVRIVLATPTFSGTMH